MTKCRLSPLAFGLSLGVVWGVSVLIMGLLAFHFSYGTEFVSAMGVLYIGYESSIIGSLIGGLYGFIDALIGGALIAWLYNCFSGCCRKNCD
jgi:hypothetical protein